MADTRLDPDLHAAASVMGGAGRSVFAAPIRAGESLVGAIYLSRRAAPPGDASGSPDPRLLEVATMYAELGAALIQRARERASLETQLGELGEAPRPITTRILGGSTATRELVAQVRKVAASTVPVLLLGETGTGKEIVAQEIHRWSARARGPFVAVHCGAIAPELLASELFGHKKGAFTQALRDRPGFFRAADGGTIFLDEIGEMPLAQQVALLRVLQEQTVTPVGDEASVPVDVRVVCATNRPLDKAIAEKSFRQDLYFRIAGVTLTLPPLRDRGRDVIELAAHFLRRERRRANRPELAFTDGALVAMRRARWEGNVRELEAAVRRAVTMGAGPQLTEADLGLAPVADPSFVRPLALARDEYLKEYVREVVERFGGNRTAAAEALLVTPRTIFRYLEEL
ncbi:MAG: sigma-54 dependent transcriptional regulator [Polyangiaceae bacterium]